MLIVEPLLSELMLVGPTLFAEELLARARLAELRRRVLIASLTNLLPGDYVCLRQ